MAGFICDTMTYCCDLSVASAMNPARHYNQKQVYFSRYFLFMLRSFCAIYCAVYHNCK